uniref:Uncharacterized protein n=1 Tax=viral metagenome TaxID=1070528 RepID=A0A6H2A2U7_9ZZZZ
MSDFLIDLGNAGIKGGEIGSRLKQRLLMCINTCGLNSIGECFPGPGDECDSCPIKERKAQVPLNSYNGENK